MPLRWNWSISCTSENSRYVPYDGDASGEATDIINGVTKATSNHSSGSNNTVATHSLSGKSGSGDTTVDFAEDDTGGNVTNRVGGVTKTAINHSGSSNNNNTIDTHSLSRNSGSGDSCSVGRRVSSLGSEKRVPRSINASSLWPPIQASPPLMPQSSDEQCTIPGGVATMINYSDDALSERTSSLTDVLGEFSKKSSSSLSPAQFEAFLLMQETNIASPGGDAMMVNYSEDACSERSSSLTEVLGEFSKNSSSSRSPAGFEGGRSGGHREGGSSAFVDVAPRSSGGSSIRGREAASSSTNKESDPSSSNRFRRIPPRPRKFKFMDNPHNTQGSDGSNNTKDDSNCHAATSDMFTEEDVNAITPLQIDAYLTTKQREEIGTRVLYSKLSGNKGGGGGKWTLASGDGQECETCSMPRLIMRGSLVEVPCPVCPEVKRRVLKSILDGCI